MFASRRALSNELWRLSRLASRLQRTNVIIPSINTSCASQLHTSISCCNGNTAVHKKFGVTVTEATSQQDHNNSPVVVILGWNSSKDKHLAKYSELFEKNNYSTVRVTANPFNTFFRTGSKVKEISHHVLDTLKEIRCEDRPLFLYAFSNGGCAMFFHTLEALTTANTRHYNAFSVTGTIFDSCPVNPNIESVKIVQESVTDIIRNPLVKSIVWYSLGILTPLVVYFNPDVKRFMSVLEKSPLKCPHLVLYSKSDKLAPYKDIDEHIDARKQQGVAVWAKCWENSQHVSHYREHTEEYVKLLNKFIDHCLGK